MTNTDLLHAMGRIDPGLIAAAAPDVPQKKPQHKTWIKWASLATCLCLVIGVAFRIANGFIPSQATDMFREGNLIEITSESDLPAQYDGKLLAFNLDFPQYEFYYKQDGIAENTEDWYSLLALKSDDNGKIVLHCMFGDTTIDDWKVSRVFTEKATETITINGIPVQIARQEPSLQYEYWHYAIFEYDDVVYDIRIQSDNSHYVFDVLNTILSSESNNQS